MTVAKEIAPSRSSARITACGRDLRRRVRGADALAPATFEGLPLQDARGWK
jgi:hypothetical protein